MCKKMFMCRKTYNYNKKDYKIFRHVKREKLITKYFGVRNSKAEFLCRERLHSRWHHRVGLRNNVFQRTRSKF